MDRTTLLLTRPQAQSARFAAEVRARFGPGLPVVIAPLMDIRALPFSLTEAAAPDAVVFSSENAVAAFAAQSGQRGAAYCVGRRTDAAARAAGFAVAGTAEDAAALAAQLSRALPGSRLLHPRGRHVAADLGALLAPAGIMVTEVTVYDQSALPLPDTARAILSGTAPVIVPLFSPRSARLFRAGAPGATAPLRIAAMSRAVADAAGPGPADRIEVAARPDAAAMLDAIGRLIDAG